MGPWGTLCYVHRDAHGRYAWSGCGGVNMGVWMSGIDMVGCGWMGVYEGVYIGMDIDK